MSYSEISLAIYAMLYNVDLSIGIRGIMSPEGVDISIIPWVRTFIQLFHIQCLYAL